LTKALLSKYTIAIWRSAPLLAHQLGDRSAAPHSRPAARRGPLRSARWAQHALLYELFEQRRRIHRNQAGDRNPALGDYDFLASPNPLDPARQLSSQRTDRNVHVTIVQSG
jgi:hypothetical protein